MSIYPSKIAIALCLVLLFGDICQAAIAFDAVSTGNSGIAANTIFWSHTCSGDNRVIIVGCIVPSLTTTDVLYNGVSITKSTSIAITGGEVSLWYLVAPLTGTHIVSAVFSGAYTSADCGSISLTGVDQSSPIDAISTSSGTGTTASLNITTVANKAWVVDIVGNVVGSSGFTVGGSQTQRWNSTNLFDDGAGSTLGPVTPAGSTAMSWTQSSAVWGQAAVSFQPAALILSADDPNLLLMQGAD